ncbi:MAG: DUF2845 domain-containing protein [Ectothiorhodospiraceae bacterium]|nr:DUF2845 domain-containing protein [Ectothiorhodospiraceae bacterium]
MPLRLLSFLPLLALCLAWSSAQASSLRCDGGLVSVGDRTWQVERMCGEPDLREPLDVVLVADGSMVTETERWYYNRGPRYLVRVVEFRDGRVRGFDVDGYGYREFPGSGCPARLIQRGMSRMELLARCGPPDASQTLAPRRHVDPRYPGVHALRPFREEWMYEFGPGQLGRIVTIEGGRVVRVETGPRTP